MTSNSLFYAVSKTRPLLEIGGELFLESVHRPLSETGRHQHDRARLCLVVAGGFEEEDATGRRWTRSGGTLLLYPSGAEHKNRFSKWGARCLNIELRDDIDSWSADAVRDAPVTLAGTQARLALRIYDATRAGAGPRILLKFLERLRSELASWSPDSADLPPVWLDSARRKLEDEAREGIALRALADHCGVDRFALARTFRRHFGCSVGQYRQSVQVRLARHALLATDEPLSRIAYRLGFADQSHFTRIFRRHTSLPPGRYRDSGG